MPAEPTITGSTHSDDGTPLLDAMGHDLPQPDSTVVPPGSVETPVATGGSGEPESLVADSTSTPPTPPEPAPAKGFMRRIDTLTREKGDLSRNIQAKDTEIQLLRQQLAGKTPGETPAGATPGAPVPGFVPLSEVENRAMEIAAARHFDRVANEIVINGREKHADFDNSVSALRSLGMTPAFVNTVMEAAGSEKTPSLLYELGKNADRAVEIMSLSPIQQAAQLARMADGLGTTAKAAPVKAAATPEPEVTRAPRPVPTIVGGRAAGTRDVYNSDNLSDEEWIAMRDADVQSKRGKVRNYSL